MRRVDTSKARSVNGQELNRHNAAELKQLKVEYQRIARTLFQVEEEERRGMAREIHDNLSQPLTALKIHLFSMARGVPEVEKALLDRLAQVVELVDLMTGTVKGLSVQLRPGVLDDLGLAAAVEWQVADFRRRTGIACDLEVEPGDNAMEGQIASVVFRIVQRMLTSISEHAKATRVRIKLRTRVDRLYLEVNENGDGIAGGQVIDHRSLVPKETAELAHLFGGDVSIRSGANEGTTITVVVPLHSGGEASDTDTYRR